MPKTITRFAIENDLLHVLEMAHALADFHGDAATLTLANLSRDALGERPWITLLVAERAGTLVGYAALCPLIQLQFGVRGMDMHHLFVSSEHRGTGVGRSLIEASLEATREKGGAYLAVGTHPDNVTAQRFYESAGFERTLGGPRFRIKLSQGS